LSIASIDAVPTRRIFTGEPIAFLPVTASKTFAHIPGLNGFTFRGIAYYSFPKQPGESLRNRRLSLLSLPLSIRACVFVALSPTLHLAVLAISPANPAISIS